MTVIHRRHVPTLMVPSLVLVTRGMKVMENHALVSAISSRPSGI